MNDHDSFPFKDRMDVMVDTTPDPEQRARELAAAYESAADALRALAAGCRQGAEVERALAGGYM